jgi:O-antigen/teichoic acid export membrane protein
MKLSAALLDQLLTSSLNFITMIFIAQKSGLNALAVYGYFMAIVGLTDMLSNALLYQDLIRERKNLNAKFCLENLRRHSQLSFAISFIVAIPTATFLSFQNATSMAGITALSICSIAFIFGAQAFSFERRIRYFADVSRSRTLKSPALLAFLVLSIRLVVFLVFMPTSVPSVMACLALSSLPLIVFQLFELSKKDKDLQTFRSFCCEKVVRGRSFLIEIPFGWGIGKSPVFFIGFILGDIYAGVYVALRGVVNAGNILTELVPTWFSSYLVKISGDGIDSKRRKFIRRSIVLFTFVWLFGLLFLYVSNKIIFRLLDFEATPENELALYILWLIQLFAFINKLVIAELKIINISSPVPLSSAIAFLSFCAYFMIYSQGVSFIHIVVSIVLMYVAKCFVLYTSLAKKRREMVNDCNM